MNFSQIYTKFCKRAGKFEKLKNFQEPTQELQQNLEKTRLKVTGEEVIASAFLAAILGVLLLVPIFLGFLIFRFSIILTIFAAPLPFALYFFVGWYPKWGAEKSKNKGWDDFPRLISYLAAALRINPNLEKAVNFTAEQGEYFGKGFRSELWKACIGVHNNAGEALTEFGKSLGEENEGVKRSIDLMKSSVTEPDEKSRRKILDRSAKTCFEEVQDRIEKFASNLQLPTTIIYGIGVLLPLILLAVLPVLSSTGLQIGGIELGLFYCIILPLGVFLFQKKALDKRPTTFSSSKLELQNNKITTNITAIILAISPPIVTYFIDFSRELVLISLLWGITCAISVFCYLSTKEAFGIRIKNRKLEEEFCDSLTQLANQLKSGYPAERSFQKTAEITEGSEMSKILSKTSINLRAGGMSLQAAFFDPDKGSLSQVHSELVRHTFRMMVNLLGRSTQAAGDAILQMANHLRRLSKVEKQARRSLQEIANSMKSVTLFFAPLIASVTVRLQGLLSDKTANLPFFGAGVQIPFATFLGILGFYVITLTILLTFYVVEIEYGDDRVMKRMNLAKTLPISMFVFTIGYVMGGQVLSIMVG